MNNRPSRPRQVTQRVQPAAAIPVPPGQHRRTRHPHPPGDLGIGQTLRRTKHDPRPSHQRHRRCRSSQHRLEPLFVSRFQDQWRRNHRHESLSQPVTAKSLTTRDTRDARKLRTEDWITDACENSIADVDRIGGRAGVQLLLSPLAVTFREENWRFPVSLIVTGEAIVFGRKKGLGRKAQTRLVHSYQVASGRGGEAGGTAAGGRGSRRPALPAAKRVGGGRRPSAPVGCVAWPRLTVAHGRQPPARRAASRPPSTTHPPAAVPPRGGIGVETTRAWLYRAG